MEEICFVIQPFDGGKFDKRYEDVYKPAIIEAGLKPYRVDADEFAMVPIETIEEKIKEAAICLADISTNNPNVWYEVGYAIASKKTTVLVCSDERTGNYPFDIRQRNVLNYKTESASDFNEFKKKLTTRINAWKKSNPILSVSVETDNREGLSEQEIKLIESTLALQETPDEYVSTWGIKEEMKRRGFNEVAFNIAVRKLLVKNFVETSVEHDYNGNGCNVLTITSLGNDWILKNEDKFSFYYS